MLFSRIIVTGGRHHKFEDRGLIWDALSRYHAARQFDLVVQGGADGVDSLAKLWCFNNGVPCATVEAQWRYYGKFRAGPIRNYWMASLFDIHGVLAFPGGSGTADMIRQAETVGLPIIKIEPEE